VCREEKGIGLKLDSVLGVALHGQDPVINISRYSTSIMSLAVPGPIIAVFQSMTILLRLAAGVRGPFCLLGLYEAEDALGISK